MISIKALLATGAGITRRKIYPKDDESPVDISAEQNFDPTSLKATGPARELVRRMAERIAGAGSGVDFIAVYEARLATLVLARLLAAMLSRSGTRVGVFSARRPKASRGDSLPRELLLTYYLGEEVVCLKSLRDQRATDLLAGRRVLFFTDLLAGSRVLQDGRQREGILHMMFAPAISRFQIQIVGLAALAIRESGYARLLQRLEVRGKRRPPVFFLHHYEERSLSSPDSPEESWPARLYRSLTKLRRGESETP